MPAHTIAMDGLFVRAGIGLALAVLLVLALRPIPFVLPSYLFYAATRAS